LKLAIQHHLLPGETLTEKFERAAAFGFDGIELTAWGLPGSFAEAKDAIDDAVRASGLGVSALCTMRDDDFVHPDPEERSKRSDRLAHTLAFADSVGAAGVIAVPIRQPLTMPNLAPFADARKVTTELATRILTGAIATTAEKDAKVFLEPLNRYETRFLNTIAQAADLCRQAGTPRVRILADLFHMNIEEADPAAALAEAGPLVGHVHLADSNRHLPGHGHTDFVAPFRSLHSAGFEGWLAVECMVLGEPEETVPDAVRFVHECWQRAEDLEDA
jgi:sugar phosphate isomerase/epimerase